MKRMLIGSLVLAFVAAPLLVRDASAAGIKKPNKIDGKTLTIVGGNPWPIGYGSSLYGVVDISFDAPLPSTPVATSFTVTCTPVLKGTVGPNAPTAPNVKTFTGFSSTYAKLGGSTAGYDKIAGKIHLTMNPYVDPVTSLVVGPQFPSLACAVDASNAGGTASGKAPKLPTSPAADCGPLAATNKGNGVALPDVPSIKAPGIVPLGQTGEGKFALYEGVTINAGALTFAYCSTNDDRGPRFLTDNTTIFTSGQKVKFKAAKGATAAVRHATVKKLVLDSPVNSPVPLSTSGSTVVYKFDPTLLQVVSAGGVHALPAVGFVSSAGCAVKDAKTAGKHNVCSVNNVTGTITVTSDDISVVKVGKDIVSPALTVDFDWSPAAATATSASITFDHADTSITIGNTTVAVTVQPSGVNYANAGIPLSPPDPNINFPIVTFAGLQ